MVVDTVGAFCPHGRFELSGAPAGPLAGRTFAVKDLFDIEGRVTGAGNPQWLATHGPAKQTAPPVAALLAAHPVAFKAVQYLGAAYLAWVGFRLLFPRRLIIR